MFTSFGKLVYSTNPLKVILEVDQGLVDLYFSLVPKYVCLKRQMYKAHISVVRNTTPPNFEFWNKYQGHKFKFQYDNFIFNDDRYYWLKVSAPDLEKVRLELGLPSWGDVTFSPDGQHVFHITIGNTK